MSYYVGEIQASWLEHLQVEFEAPYMKQLKVFLTVPPIAVSLGVILFLVLMLIFIMLPFS
ncbi:MAG: hypothetical protein U9O64_04845 [Campylobacterota bacterium]|nr:hypothetical protein [Campylobacterota bacterium]